MALTRAVADTSIFIAREVGRSLDEDRVPSELTVSAITIGELRAGVLGAEGPSELETRLVTFTQALSFDPVPVDEHVAEMWARLRLALRGAGRRMPINDSWIAATAMSLGIPVVAQDADYDEVPGLDVIRV